MELAGNRRGHDHGGWGGRGGDHHGAEQVAPHAPHGFYVFCGCVTAAAAAVIAVNLLHHPGGAVPRASGPAPVVSSASAAAPTVSLPATAPSAPASQVSVPAAGRPASGDRSAPAPSDTGSRTPTGPHPSPAAPSGAAVAVAAVLQVRTPPMPVRVVLAVPGAPPLVALDGLLLP